MVAGIGPAAQADRHVDVVARQIGGQIGGRQQRCRGRARRLEQVEVRAYGCLLEELVERLAPGAVRDGLDALRARCLTSTPAQRPGFEAIVGALAALGAPA